MKSFSCGAMLSWHADVRNKPGWIGRYRNKQRAIAVKLVQDPQQKKGLWIANGEAQSIITADGEIAASGGIILKWKEDGDLPANGAIILCAETPLRIPASTGAGGFDFQHDYQNTASGLKGGRESWSQKHPRAPALWSGRLPGANSLSKGSPPRLCER